MLYSQADAGLQLPKPDNVAAICAVQDFRNLQYPVPFRKVPSISGKTLYRHSDSVSELNKSFRFRKQ